MQSSLKIGGACGFWGESPHATGQLLTVPGLSVLVYDYLAEITMSIMARARLKDATAGYARDFVTEVMVPNLDQISARGVKVLSNAGGVNPRACAAALRDVIAERGLDLKVAVVEGDDLLPRATEFADEREMFSGAAFPPGDRIASMNAYLGAGPVAAALDAGADIVITGRCADSALTLAVCVHHFGWSWEDYDLLASGSLAGHLLECGPQATGGNFTDWERAGDIATIGYPVVEIAPDGCMSVTKPHGTSGEVNRFTIAEQMVYEIGDPRAYLLPDVICDFADVEIEEDGPDHVIVRGAKGRAPSGMLKVSTTWMDGYRAGMVLQFNGRAAREKARVYAQAALDRASGRLASLGAPDYRETLFETFGGAPGAGQYEEITLKAAVRHDDPRAVGIFLKELIGAALATPPGLHFFTGGGRPKPSPVVALFSFLVAGNEVVPSVELDGKPVTCSIRMPEPGSKSAHQDTGPVPDAPKPLGKDAGHAVPLEQVAVARAGDKGDKANIGVIARNPAYLPYIWAALTPDEVAACFAGELKGEVERFYLPGCGGMNLLLHEVLGGGGVASLRNDAQGKGFAQRLLQFPVTLPSNLLPNRP
ncbi:MAG: terpene utilization protein AtuA [Rhodobacterales bacterium]|nr:MAG: terpene utilization protein AtuA [Rhodobacterales bacterium]